MSTNYTQQISEEECIGDSLDTINDNFSSLDEACTLLFQLSTQFMILKPRYNTLVRTLSAAGTSQTTYANLSTTLRSLSSFILP